MRWYEVAFGVLFLGMAAACASLAKKVKRYCFFI
jgi:hypothetical protein